MIKEIVTGKDKTSQSWAEGGGLDGCLLSSVHNFLLASKLVWMAGEIPTQHTPTPPPIHQSLRPSLQRAVGS